MTGLFFQAVDTYVPEILKKATELFPKMVSVILSLYVYHYSPSFSTSLGVRWWEELM